MGLYTTVVPKGGDNEGRCRETVNPISAASVFRAKKRDCDGSVYNTAITELITRKKGIESWSWKERTCGLCSRTSNFISKNRLKPPSSTVSLKLFFIQQSKIVSIKTNKPIDCFKEKSKSFFYSLLKHYFRIIVLIKFDILPFFKNCN